MMDSQEPQHTESKLLNSGWMYKKGKLVSNWKRRYFELFDNGKLNYFTEETKRTKKTHKGTADLSIIIGLNLVDNKNFEVITPTRIWCFQCKFRSECEEWMKSMKNVSNSYLCNNADKPNKSDYLKLSSNESILKLIAKIGDKDGERILYSDQITQIDSKQKEQKRILLLTNIALYDIKPNDAQIYKKCEKRIAFEKIPCCTIVNSEQFQIESFCYHTSTKNIKTIIGTLIKADIELIYAREEDESEFSVNFEEEDQDGDVSDLYPQFSEYRSRPLAVDVDDDDDEKEKKLQKRKVKPKTDRLRVRDFKFLSVIGRGTFGKILLVQKKADDQIYAMKILKKTQIIASGQQKNVNAEREVLKSIKHPFMLSLRYAFQTESKLYLLLDYYRGGELMFHLKRYILQFPSYHHPSAYLLHSENVNLIKRKRVSLYVRLYWQLVVCILMVLFIET